MRTFRVLLKKEFNEAFRTKKALIILLLFFAVGVMNPFIAKYTPVILNAVMPEEMMETMNVVIPEPTAADAWAQFFSNMGQIGLLVLTIIFCGLMASELSKGTLVNLLTKGVCRGAVIFSKLAYASAVWTLAYAFSAAVSKGFTAAFWPGSAPPHMLAALFYMWLYGLFLISLSVLGGVLFKGVVGCLLSVAALVVAMTVLNIVPPLARYNPISLGTQSYRLLSGVSPGEFLPAALLCASLTAAACALAVLAFGKKEL